MFLCLRIDLDYVPWDSPDAHEFGHGEPAAFLKLLDLARSTGNRFHFFVSNRVLRAFPATAEAILNEGHDLDWFHKHPEEATGRFDEAIELFSKLGHKPTGLSVKSSWPTDAKPPANLSFLSANAGSPPQGIRLFSVDTKSDRDVARNGISVRVWTETIKAQIRDAASRNGNVTISVRPQVLAKFDPKLTHVREMLEIARAVGLPIKTLRQALDD